METREKDLDRLPNTCGEPRKGADIPWELTEDAIYFSDSDNGSRKYANVLMRDGTEISERIPLHVFKMSPSDMEFAFRDISLKLRRKVIAYGKTHAQPTCGELGGDDGKIDA